jgi:aminoglycoside phosphotransferase (APT) family kinase protein
MAGLFERARLQEMLDDGRSDGLPAELRDAARLAGALQRTADLPVTCMIHGDTHSGNVFTDRQGRVGWFDWQLAQRGSWSVDVAYHLGAVLPTPTRRAHEADLLRHYLEQLGAGGVTAPTFEDAWELYIRSAAWGYFLWAITMITSRAIVEIHVPRLGAALADHETFRLLGA